MKIRDTYGLVHDYNPGAWPPADTPCRRAWTAAATSNGRQSVEVVPDTALTINCLFCLARVR